MPPAAMLHRWPAGPTVQHPVASRSAKSGPARQPVSGVAGQVSAQHRPGCRGPFLACRPNSVGSYCIDAAPAEARNCSPEAQLRRRGAGDSAAGGDSRHWRGRHARFNEKLPDSLGAACPPCSDAAVAKDGDCNGMTRQGNRQLKGRGSCGAHNTDDDMSD
ncbi:hypothetical protein PF008_g14511 [Phytophthora fragariae]|uniref:Uncharacterized protein n=1 Tax=Phytophthora fragariae TaxID=53985 RepID=A0A6G0RH97_9STRA|nr:hypothetical protein PF008_g14511 [Phytophthora fragariae]